MFTGVCLSTGGCLVPGGLLLVGFMVGGGVCSQQGGGGSVPGVPDRGGCLLESPPLRTATAEGSTHPTGMHSCLENANIDCKNNHLLP